jgi:hypothetical protein
MTLLGRIGRRLARFGGTGFVRVEKGIAVLTETIPVKISGLWHRWASSTEFQPPSPQEALPAPYGVVADTSGKLYLIRGALAEKSVQVWNPATNAQEPVPVSEIDLCRKGNLARSEELVLVGFEQIQPEDSPSSVKCLKALEGSGLIVVEERDTVLTECLCDGCTPAPAKVSVAKFLPNPEGEGVFALKFSQENGHFWEPESD